MKVEGYVTKVPTRTATRLCKRLEMLTVKDQIDPIQSSLFLQAVDVFDGSTIADPVVVSGVFWASLKAKIISVLIGQILAALVFALLTYFLSSQLSRFGEFIATEVFKEDALKVKLQKINKSISNERKSSVVQPDFQKLLLCIVIDTLGTASELVPFVGEISDVIYAPIAALALRSLYGNSNVIFAMEFVEEFLPFTDILPLATICWIIETFYEDSNIAKTLQIGAYGKTYDSSAKLNVIDAEYMGSRRKNDSL